MDHNLQVTGKFEILTVTERISTFCPCVVTNRTGAGRHLYITTSVDAQTGNVRAPGRRFKRTTRHRTVSADFAQMKHLYMCHCVYIKMIIRHHASKIQVVKSKDEARFYLWFYPDRSFLPTTFTQRLQHMQ